MHNVVDHISYMRKRQRKQKKKKKKGNGICIVAQTQYGNKKKEEKNVLCWMLFEVQIQQQEIAIFAHTIAGTLT